MSNLLYIVNEFPFPTTSGDKLYIISVLRALAQEFDGAITVVCGGKLEFQKELIPEELQHIRWLSFPGSRFPSILSLFSLLPRASKQAFSRTSANELNRLMRKDDFDYVLYCQCTVAVAIPKLLPVSIKSGRRTQFVYVSQNCEAKLRFQVASEEKRHFQRIVKLLDAYKYSKLESLLVARSDVISTVSQEDQQEFRQIDPAKEVVIIRPSFPGKKRRPSEFRPSESTRTVLFLGSFDWGAKQLNLLECITAYLTSQMAGLVPKDIKLRVAGRMPSDLKERLSISYPSIEIKANFKDLADVMDDVRFALCLERVGGGVKIKTLDYAFRSVPMIALPECMAGTPFLKGQDYLACEDARDAWVQVNKYVEDFEFIGSVSASAFQKACLFFDSREGVRELLNTRYPRACEIG